MDKTLLKQIILRQQEFISSLSIIDRGVVFEQNVNYVLVGMRRAGKSYLLYSQIQKLVELGENIERMLFINFEDERINGMQQGDLHLILEAYSELFEHQPIIFLDEIQNVKGWEHFARRLADEKYRVYITGSNAQMLSKEMAGALGGRYMVKEVFPFSFAEFLKYQGFNLTKNWLYESTKNDVVRLFNDYFYEGGLSEVFDVVDKRSWLTSLYHKVIYGDVALRMGLKSDTTLRLIMKKLAESVLQPMSIQRMKNILDSVGTRTTRETISQYISYLNDAYLTFSISNINNSLSEREGIKKHYFFDNGILNLFLSQSASKLLENLVAITLFKKFGADLYYYNQNVEVDFIEKESGLAMQVCYDLNDEETKKREIKALVAINKIFTLKDNIIVTRDTRDEFVVNDIKIKVIPIWEFLLSDL